MAFGYAGALLEGIPLFGLFFMMTNVIGAGLWAVELERTGMAPKFVGVVGDSLPPPYDVNQIPNNNLAGSHLQNVAHQFGGNQQVQYGGNQHQQVQHGGNQQMQYGGNHQVQYGGNQQVQYGSNHQVQYGGNQQVQYGGNQSMLQSGQFQSVQFVDNRQQHSPQFSNNHPPMN